MGEFSASGFIFKDSVETVAVEDPDGSCVSVVFMQPFLHLNRAGVALLQSCNTLNQLYVACSYGGDHIHL